MAVVLILSVAAMAQQPVITFEKTSHDFGKINEADGKVTTVFAFKNEGMAPLVLSNVRASCGCTTPKWTREPIEPGQTGEITVTYNPSGRPGHFQKTITVTSNATESTKKLSIKGEVIPKSATPVDQYPVKMGNLSLKQRALDFGSVTKGSGEGKVLTIEYANKTQENVTVDLYLGQGADMLNYNLTMKTLKPNETGQFQVSIDRKATADLYGPFSVKVWIVVDGKKDVLKDENFVIVISGDMKEDFSRLSAEQRKLAPISQVGKTIEFGTMSAGKKYKKTITLRNIGTNTLIVRRVYCKFDKLVTVSVPKTIKSGKKGDIKFELNTLGLNPGTYKREMQIITNDPATPVQKLTVIFTIQ